MKHFKDIKIGSEVVYQPNEDGMMIYVPEEGMIHAVNLTAADVLLFVEKGYDTIETITKKMIEKYVGVEYDQLFLDIKMLLNSLEELKIIVGN